MSSMYEAELLSPPISDSVTTSCGFTGLSRTSSLRNSIRRREPIWILNIRQQLNEQLKLLDGRLDSHLTLLTELQDFYRRRAEVEVEYSKSLDKVIKQIMTRHKTEKLKRDTWPGFSTYSLWQTLLGTTRKVGRDHAVLGELYTAQMVTRLSEIAEDVQRIYKKCREMAVGCHEELLRVLGELQSAMKTYHLYHNDFLQAEAKLTTAEGQLQKLEAVAVAANKTGLGRKLKNFAKHTDKKRQKYTECRLKAVKARNEYILCIGAANAATQRYFSDDLQELINTMDYGYHSALSQTVLMHISAEENLIHSQQGCLVLMNQRARGLDQRLDKQVFLDSYPQFSPPTTFEFQPYRGDTINHLTAEKTLQEDLLDRLNAINDRLNSLHVENDEIWKTLESTDSSLMRLIVQDDHDVTHIFQSEGQTAPSASSLLGDREKRRTDRLETEEFYLTKFRQFQSSNSIMSRLQAKHDCIEQALAMNNCSLPDSNRSAQLAPPKPRKRNALGHSPLVGQARLFGGTINEYVQSTGEDIPLVVRSCIRAINLYGMHHQGVFRISGSQHEINDYKSQFERGKDPIPDKVDSKDINSIAGVLKLYFRELKEPLFPNAIFDNLVSFCNEYSFNDERMSLSVIHIRDMLISLLSRPVLIVMRYLFAFLNHLSEFSDENMMDPYNLAICFGPTLLPVPSDRDLVLFQGHVNELIRNIIIYQEEIFPYDGGTVYERFIADVNGRREDSLDNLSDDEDIIADHASEEDVFYDQDLVREGVALYDFTGRTNRELSFRKGERIMLFEKVSADWWEGSMDEREGLIPDKYIHVRTSDVPDANTSTVDNKSVESLQSKSSNKITRSPRPSDTSSMTNRSSSQTNVTNERPLSHHTSPGVVKRPVPIPRRSTSPMPHPRSSLPAQMSPGCSSSASSSYTDDDSALRSLPSSSPISARRASADELDSTVDGKEFVKRVRPPLFKVREKKDVIFDGKEKTSKSDPNQLASTSDMGKISSIDYVLKIKESAPVVKPSNEKESAYVSGSLDSVEDPDAFKTAEDLALDIDTALAEVMSGIQSLGASQGRCQDDIRRELEIKCTEINDKDIFDVHIVTMPPKEHIVKQEASIEGQSSGLLVSQSHNKKSSFSQSKDDFKRTPDLVIDLPLNSVQPPSPPVKATPAVSSTVMVSPSDSTGRQLTTAEMFAKADQCTIKKGTSVSSSNATSVTVATGITKSTRGSETSSNDTPEVEVRRKVERIQSSNDRQTDGVNKSFDSAVSRPKAAVAARFVSGRISPNYDNVPLMDEEVNESTDRIAFSGCISDRNTSIGSSGERNTSIGSSGERNASIGSFGRKSDSGVSSGPPSAAVVHDASLSFNNSFTSNRRLSNDESLNLYYSSRSSFPDSMSKSYTPGMRGLNESELNQSQHSSNVNSPPNDGIGVIKTSSGRNPVQKSHTLASASDRIKYSTVKPESCEKKYSIDSTRSSTLEKNSGAISGSVFKRAEPVKNEPAVSTEVTTSASTDRGRVSLPGRSVSVVERCVSSVIAKTTPGSVQRIQSSGAADRGGVKPPIKSKPPIMKKPSRSGEGLSPIRTNEGDTAELSSARF